MYERKKLLSFIAFALVLAVVTVARAQQDQAKPQDKPAVTPVAVSVSPSELLPDRLAGVRATGEIKQYGSDDLARLVADQAPVYQEYRVVSAFSREYGPARVDVFVAEDRFAAFGLFSYVTGAEGRAFYKGNHFVRISDANSRRGERMAQEVAAAIKYEGEAPTRPPLLDSLPREFMVGRSERYFLGPASIAAYVEDGRDMIGFAGDAEAAMAEYRKDQNVAAGPVAQSAFKLIIVEYHTPPFATEAFGRVSDYINSLPEQERSRFILKREGNYVVQAVNVEDREFAEQVVSAIEYPYTVKWLRDPLLPTNDPFRHQKAAEMLLSTFGILGLILMTVLVGGGTFGTVIFLKRRKRQQEIFSDAGGMLRLDLDPFEATMLGLPPKRGED